MPPFSTQTRTLRSILMSEVVRDRERSHTMNPILLRRHNVFLCAAIEVYLMILISFILISCTLPPLGNPILSQLTKMPKPIPLRTPLRIKRQNIIIHRPRHLVKNVLMKRLPSKTRHFGLIQLPIRRDPYPVDDFCSCRDGVGGCEAVEHS